MGDDAAVSLRWLSRMLSDVGRIRARDLTRPVEIRFSHAEYVQLCLWSVVAEFQKPQRTRWQRYAVHVLKKIRVASSGLLSSGSPHGKFKSISK
jgi:hypothetical protein